MDMSHAKRLKRTLRTVNADRPGGFSLLEVLIALLVLSIGLIGMAALHFSSLKSAHSSYFRSVASLMAVDAEERLWLELADAPQDNFPDLAAVETRWALEWSTGDFDLPGFNGSIIDQGDGGVGLQPQWKDIRVNVQWTETRLATGNPNEQASDTEVFDYWFRILRQPEELPDV